MFTNLQQHFSLMKDCGVLFMEILLELLLTVLLGNSSFLKTDIHVNILKMTLEQQMLTT